MQKTYATGRRQTAVARVWLTAGGGRVTTTERSDEASCSRPPARMVIRQALEEVALLAQYDVHATVRGGGIASQAGAIRHGITRALMKVDSALRPQPPPRWMPRVSGTLGAMRGPLTSVAPVTTGDGRSLSWVAAGVLAVVAA